ncbi:hypothetical protein Forpe1208_v003586 [Fusarium oxysporum f. sp. rapae]|uniref:LisH domain-containing protein n=1 Tax=Fusarium oxysporum f. sp. rapae TaxID=485398 RepID=A0A8J5PHN9_FUSOX|nr:hypothetical protein Forpe1208_v003586 [Fusarium oxysporum f. sp. rapae]
MANMKAMTGHPHDASRHLQENYNKLTQLNTYIYEYFLRNGMFQCAQSILKADSDAKVQKHSPSNDRNDKGCRLKKTQQNWTNWNASWPQTQSSSLLLQAPGSASHNAFYSTGEMGLTRNIELDICKAEIDGIGSKSEVQMTQQPVATKVTAFQQEGKTGHNWSVQWQNDSNENPIPWTSQCGVQGTQQERSCPPSVKPADANDSAKPRSTIPSPSQTSKSALPTLQLSKAARKKGLSPKRTTPKKRTMNVKDEMVTYKIPKLNVGSTATRPPNAAPNPALHINPVGTRKDAQSTSLAQVVPIGQPAVPLPLTPASMAANPPVSLVQSATFGMEVSNDFASLPTFNSDLHDFDIGAFLESSAEDVGDFHLNYFPFNMDADNIDQN